MKDKNGLSEEASIFRLLYFLSIGGVPFGTSLEVIAGTFPKYRLPFMSMLRGFREDVGVGKLFVDQKGHFSDFVPELFSTLPSPDDEHFLDVVWETAIILSRSARLAHLNVSAHDIGRINFYRVLSAMARFSGDGILHALTVAGNQFLSPDVTKKIVETVKSGETLAYGLKLAQGNFSDIDIATMDVGEQTGSLPESCYCSAELNEQILLVNKGNPQTPATADFTPLGDLTSMVEYQLLFLMLTAGLPTTRALKSFADNSTDERRRGMYLDLVDHLENKGLMLSEAMDKFPEYFPGHAIALIRLTENSGELDITFRRLAEHLKWELLGIEPAREFKPVPA